MVRDRMSLINLSDKSESSNHSSLNHIIRGKAIKLLEEWKIMVNFTKDKVEITWNNFTRKHYIDRGYTFTKEGEPFLAKVVDLPKGSTVKVDVICDYCEGNFKRPYKDIVYSIEKSFTKRYSCKKCTSKKRLDEESEKQIRGLLNREDKGYWNFKENRVSEIKDFIRKHGGINNMQKIDTTLYSSILKHDISVYQLLKEIGIEWDSVSSKAPVGYYRDFNNLKEKIDIFIEKYDRFPSYSEFYSDMSVKLSVISYHGGIENVKKKMNYVDKEDYLVDDSGYKNSSLLEYMVAQYLLRNKISCRRNKRIFSTSQHRYDFLIEGIDGNKFYVEVWGFGKKDKSLKGVAYNNSRIEKEALYRKHKMNLISLEYEYLDKKSYQSIQQYLASKFSDISGLRLKVFKDSIFIEPKSLTSKAILEKIMEHSDDENTLPTTLKLREEGAYYYYQEIMKRYNSYDEFAFMFDKTTPTAKASWSMKRVYEIIDVIVSDRNPITAETMIDYGVMKASSFLFREIGSTKALTVKLKYYNEHWDTNTKMHKEDMQEILEVSNNKSDSLKTTEEDVKEARRLISKMQSISTF